MIFAQLDSEDNSIWAAVLEKMWAKAMGSFDKIVGGNPWEPYDFLLGAPSQVYFISDLADDGTGVKNYAQAAEYAWDIITENIDAGYQMGVDTSSSSIYNIITGHSYSLLGYDTVTNATDTYNLVLVRNPWGHDASYSGSWNDGDTGSWTSANLAQVEAFKNSTTDGQIWV